MLFRSHRLEEAGKEAGMAPPDTQLRDYQHAIIMLLAAWAALMRALGIAWEEPVGLDLYVFEGNLLRVQREAIIQLEQLQHQRRPPDKVRVCACHQCLGFTESAD